MNPVDNKIDAPQIGEFASRVDGNNEDGNNEEGKRVLVKEDIEERASSMQSARGAYDASNISVLKGLTAVQKRPDMYIGGTDAGGLHHLVYEVLDNAIDEALAGFCTNIHVRIEEDGFISIRDDGRGIPVDQHESGVSALEVVMTTLHAGGKFDSKSYKVSGGLHGVGVSVVCGLSEKLEADIFRNGIHYQQAYERGIPTGPVVEVGKSEKQGTKIRFKADPQIFETVEFQYDVLSKRCRELAFLNKGLRINIEEEKKSKVDHFYYEEGIKAFVRHQNSKREPIHKDIVYIDKTVELDTQDEVNLEVALQYNDEYSTDSIYTFANNINTIHGGTHLSGFKSSLTRTLNKYAKDNRLVKENDTLPDGSDYLEGLVAVVSVKLQDPKFESQTKVKLSNTEIEGIVQHIVNDELGTYLEENPSTGKAIIRKATQARAAREAARKARDLARRKTVLSSGNLPGKLADCSSRDPYSTEIYIVEGDSAGGSAKMGRLREYQAILPIRGKIINVEKTRIDRMLGHAEIQTIISALGTGIGQDDFDISKLRYGKVIIMTDADVDGSHIRTLLLTFFFRHMSALIEEGHVFIAQPPLYELIPKKGSKKKSRYIQDDKEYEEALISLGSEGVEVCSGDGSKSIRGEELKNLCKVLARLEKLEHRLGRKGISLAELLDSEKNDGVGYPTCMVEVNKGNGQSPERHFFFSEEESKEFLGRLTEETRRVLMIATDNDVIEDREKADVVVCEIHEAKTIASLAEQIRAFHFSPRVFRSKRRESLTGDLDFEPLATVRLPSGAECPVLDIVSILTKVKEQAEDLYEAKRFKGLGEMNPEQLFETTMDPENRTLLKVTINDAYTADEYFTVLMGSDVESRRNFIKKYALDVKNLDI